MYLICKYEFTSLNQFLLSALKKSYYICALLSLYYVWILCTLHPVNISTINKNLTSYVKKKEKLMQQINV